MRRGKVSYSKMRAVTRVATPETEDDLLNVALSSTAAHVEKIVRGVAAGGPPGGADRGPAAARDAVAADVGGRRRDGGWCGGVCRLRWARSCGGRSRRACDQARGTDATASDADGEAVPGAEAAPGVEAEAPSLAQRQADALGGDCGVCPVGRTRPGDGGRPLSGGGARGRGGPDRSARRSRGNVGDGIARARAGRRRPGSARGGQFGERTAARRRARARPRVRDRGGLRPFRPAAARRCWTRRGGIHISPETARGWPATRRRSGSSTASAARSSTSAAAPRTISPALRRALHARDRQCRFPGCRNVRVDAHYADVRIMPDIAQTPLPQGASAPSLSA